MDRRVIRYLNVPYGVCQDERWKRDVKRVAEKISLAQKMWEACYHTEDATRNYDDLLEHIDGMTMDYPQVRSEHEEMIEDEKELDRLMKECIEKYCSPDGNSN